MGKSKKRPVYRWEKESIRALRARLDLSQEDMAGEMGVRQQTVSEWETGLYAPRGASAKLLSILAERAQFTYQARLEEPPPEHPHAQD